MKKIILILLFTIYYLPFTILNSYAASPSPTASPNAVEQQIDQLKDRIASRVAQLNLVEKRGIIGQVTDLTDVQLTLTDLNGDTRFVDVDELTKFTNENSNGSFGISDVNKGMTLGVLGLYNKQSRRILARSVDVLTISQKVHGFIATIDLDNFILNIATDDGKQIQAEVETTTKTLSYDTTSGKLVRSGFSKIKEGQKIFVVGSKDKKVDNKIDADTIIIIPAISRTPVLQLSPTIIPSTGSGKKLTPIVK